MAQCNYVGWILAQQGVGAGRMDLRHVALSSQQETDRDFTFKELEPLVFLQLPSPTKKRTDTLVFEWQWHSHRLQSLLQHCYIYPTATRDKFSIFHVDTFTR